MNKKEARELMKDKFEKITWDEYNSADNIGEFHMYCSDGQVCFKPKEKFPKVFEDNSYKIEVLEGGEIHINNKLNGIYYAFIESVSLEILYKAVEQSKKLREKEE